MSVPKASTLEPVLQEFIDGTIHNCNFDHTQHIFVIWSLVKRQGTLPAISTFQSNLKRITQAEGAPEKYHATITHALGITVGERVAANPDQGWSDFADTNPDLFQWPSPLLEQLYPNGELDSAVARTEFVLPGGDPSRT